MAKLFNKGSLNSLEHSIKLVACDLDGTLLNPQSEVAEAEKEAIRSCLDQGIKVMIVTGRPYNFANLIRSQIDPRLGIIAAVGSQVDFADGSGLKNYCFSPEQTRQLLDILEPYQIETQLKTSSKIYYYRAKLFPNLYPDSILQGKTLENLQDFSDPDLIKVICYAVDRALRSELRNKLIASQLFTVSDGGFPGCEIVRPDRSKGIALAEALTHFNLSPNSAIAFGDANNDLSMFEAVGTSFAMANGAEELKQIATYLAPANSQHGVAQVINLILSKQAVDSELL